jgi:hypothetical protein
LSEENWIGNPFSVEETISALLSVKEREELINFSCDISFK